MDKDTNKNQENRTERDIARDQADMVKADGKMERNNRTRKVNRLWLWLGVLILIFILVWWLFSIGTFEDLLGTVNG